MKNEKKKSLILGIVSICLGLIVILGISFALFRVSHKGNFRNKLQSNFGLVLIENKENEQDAKDYTVVNLNNAIPESDEEGLAETPYKFVLKNTGDIDVMYDLTLSINGDNSIESSKLLGEEYIKYSLKENNSTKTVRLLSTTVDNTIYSGIIPAGAEKVFDLNMWIDEYANNGAMNKEFESIIKVKGYQANVLHEETIPIDNYNYKFYSNGTIIVSGEGVIGASSRFNRAIVGRVVTDYLGLPIDSTPKGLLLSTCIYFYRYHPEKLLETINVDNMEAVEDYIWNEYKSYFEQNRVSEGRYRQILDDINELPDIKNVIFEEGITEIRTGAIVFSGNFNIILPNSLTNIDKYAFDGLFNQTLYVHNGVTLAEDFISSNENTTVYIDDYGTDVIDHEGVSIIYLRK